MASHRRPSANSEPDPLAITRGERGPKGDHGQDGGRGDVGLTGELGRTGETGQTGAQGARGSAGIAWSDRRVLIGFIVLVFAAALGIQTYINQGDDLKNTRSALGATQVKLESAQGEIKKNATAILATQYESCLGGLRILVQYNESQDRLRKVYAARTDLPADVQSSYVKAYTDSKILPLPTCRAPK